MDIVSFSRVLLLLSASMLTSSVFAVPTINVVDGGTVASGDSITWSDSDSGSVYWVHVGSSIGASDIYNSGALGGTSRVLVGDWAGDIYFRLWYRAPRMSWSSIDATFTIAACPAPVTEQFNLLTARVNNGSLIEQFLDPFDGQRCILDFGAPGSDIGDDVIYRITVSPGNDPDPVRPAIVSVSGLGFQPIKLWTTRGAALACVLLIC